jgi:hypothetical protein
MFDNDKTPSRTDTLEADDRKYNGRVSGRRMVCRNCAQHLRAMPAGYVMRLFASGGFAAK